MASVRPDPLPGQVKSAQHDEAFAQSMQRSFTHYEASAVRSVRRLTIAYRVMVVGAAIIALLAPVAFMYAPAWAQFGIGIPAGLIYGVIMMAVAASRTTKERALEKRQLLAQMHTDTSTRAFPLRGKWDVAAPDSRFRSDWMGLERTLGDRDFGAQLVGKSDMKHRGRPRMETVLAERSHSTRIVYDLAMPTHRARYYAASEAVDGRGDDLAAWRGVASQVKKARQGDAADKTERMAAATMAALSIGGVAPDLSDIKSLALHQVPDMSDTTFTYNLKKTAALARLVELKQQIFPDDVLDWLDKNTDMQSADAPTVLTCWLGHNPDLRDEPASKIRERHLHMKERLGQAEKAVKAEEDLKEIKWLMQRIEKCFAKRGQPSHWIRFTDELLGRPHFHFVKGSAEEKRLSELELSMLRTERAFYVVDFLAMVVSMTVVAIFQVNFMQFVMLTSGPLLVAQMVFKWRMRRRIEKLDAKKLAIRTRQHLTMTTPIRKGERRVRMERSKEIDPTVRKAELEQILVAEKHRETLEAKYREERGETWRLPATDSRVVDQLRRKSEMDAIRAQYGPVDVKAFEQELLVLNTPAG